MLKGLSALNAAELGVSGLSFDGSGNALLGNGEACNKQDTFYQFAPSAAGKATPSATYLTNQAVSGNFIALYHDPATGYLDTSDGSQSAYLSEYLPGPSGAQLIAQFGTLGLTAQGTCILTPGVAGCTNPPTTNTFVSAPLGQDLSDQFSRTFTIDGRGNYFYPAKDSTLYNMSVVEVPSNQVIPVQDPVASAPWLRGIDTFVQTYKGIDADRVSNYPSGLAVDGNVLFVLNAPFTGLAFGPGGKRLTNYYAPAAACNPNANATPSPTSECSDGTPHEYLTAYDLTQLTNARPERSRADPRRRRQRLPGRRRRGFGVRKPARGLGRERVHRRSRRPAVRRRLFYGDRQPWQDAGRPGLRLRGDLARRAHQRRGEFPAGHPERQSGQVSDRRCARSGGYGEVAIPAPPRATRNASSFSSSTSNSRRMRAVAPQTCTSLQSNCHAGMVRPSKTSTPWWTAPGAAIAANGMKNAAATSSASRVSLGRSGATATNGVTSTVLFTTSASGKPVHDREVAGVGAEFLTVLAQRGHPQVIAVGVVGEPAGEGDLIRVPAQVRGAADEEDGRRRFGHDRDDDGRAPDAIG